MNKIEELEMKLKELSEEIERLKAVEEIKEWRPKVGNSYWYVDNDGFVHKAEWNLFGTHRQRYLIGNVFKTEEEARFRVGQLRVEAELKRFGRKFVACEKNYTLNFRHSTNSILINYYTSVQNDNIHFASEDIAQKAIDTVGEDRIKKYYFGVED